MAEKEPFNLRAFKKRMLLDRNSFRRFLTRVLKKAPRGMEAAFPAIEKQVWAEMDCLACANCCRTMTPTFNPEDVKRISAHFNMTEDQFKKKWLYKDRTGDWLNKKEPCQFLDLKTNMCSIYAIRPADCAEFPHLLKKFKAYGHVHKQNVECCPATYKMVERIREWETAQLSKSPAKPSKR